MCNTTNWWTQLGDSCDFEYLREGSTTLDQWYSRRWAFCSTSLFLFGCCSKKICSHQWCMGVVGLFVTFLTHHVLWSRSTRFIEVWRLCVCVKSNLGIEIPFHDPVASVSGNMSIWHYFHSQNCVWYSVVCLGWGGVDEWVWCGGGGGSCRVCVCVRWGVFRSYSLSLHTTFLAFMSQWRSASVCKCVGQNILLRSHLKSTEHGHLSPHLSFLFLWPHLCGLVR